MLINEPIINTWAVSSVDDIVEEEPFLSAGISNIIKKMNDNLPLADQLEFILKQMPGTFSLQKHFEFYSSLPDFVITQYQDVPLSENVFAYMDISTSHLPQSDRNKFPKDVCEYLSTASTDSLPDSIEKLKTLCNSNYLQDLIIFPYSYGWWVYTAFSCEESWISTKKAIEQHELSPTLLNILEIARNKNCKFVRFDLQGAYYENLEYFDDEII